MEVENYNDYGMPRRALVYDAAEYEKEVSERKETLLKERKLGTFEERKSGKRKDRPTTLSAVPCMTIGRIASKRK